MATGRGTWEPFEEKQCQLLTGRGRPGSRVWRRKKTLKSHLRAGRGRLAGRVETPKSHAGEGDDKNA